MNISTRPVVLAFTVTLLLGLAGWAYSDESAVARDAEFACGARLRLAKPVQPDCPVCGPSDPIAHDIDAIHERLVNGAWWTGHERDEARVLDLRPALATLLGESGDGRRALAAIDRQAPPPRHRTRPGSRAGRLIRDAVEGCQRALKELP